MDYQQISTTFLANWKGKCVFEKIVKTFRCAMKSSNRNRRSHLREIYTHYIAFEMQNHYV